MKNNKYFWKRVTHFFFFFEMSKNQIKNKRCNTNNKLAAFLLLILFRGDLAWIAMKAEIIDMD